MKRFKTFDTVINTITLTASLLFFLFAMWYSFHHGAFANDVTPSTDLAPLATSELSEEAAKIDPKIMHTCMIKMGVIKSVMDHKDTVTVNQALTAWGLDYAKVKGSVPTATEIDTQRVIRDIYRVAPTLKTEQDRDNFFNYETGWCLHIGY